jgi:hypothetical protein
MVTIFCAIGAVVILAYAALVLAYLRRLPEPEDR